MDSEKDSGGIMGKVKEIYFSFENRYYEILDKINKKIPVYDVVDPIDRVFPSFILMLILLFLLFFFGLLFLLSMLGNNAKFIVTDSNGNPIEGVLVTLSNGTDTETRTTNEFGEFETSFYGEQVIIEAVKEGFRSFHDIITIEAGRQYEILLEPETTVTVKTIEFELRDEQTSLIGDQVDVTMSFSCSSSQVAPASFAKKGSLQKVFVQSNCGTLTATINATGFEEARKTVNVAAQQGAVIVNLRRVQMYGNVRVSVRDRDTGQPIEGVSLRIKRGSVVTLQAGVTDSTGSKLVDRVPGGTYRVEATPREDQPYSMALSEEFSIGAAQFASSSPVEVVIFLAPLREFRKIYLKFVDDETGSPLSDVSALLIIDENPWITYVSGANGEVSFINLESSRRHAIIATHPEYVTKVLGNVETISSTVTTPVEVRLEKATSSNSGTARVIVKNFSGEPIANADTEIYSEEFTFPIASGKTSADGTIEYTNLFLSEYHAYAEKTIDSILYNNTSETKELVAGQVTDFPITLVIANGRIRVTVEGANGEDVEGATVNFIDSITGLQLAQQVTDERGRTETVEFKINRKPYIVVEKDGFYDHISRAYDIIPDSTQLINIALTPEAAFSEFDIRLVDVQRANGTSVNLLDDDRTYYFLFNLLVARESKGVQSVIRAGLDEHVTAADSIIVIRDISYFSTDSVFSTCYDPSDNYAECGVDSFTRDAKQVVANFHDLNAGVYEILVQIFIEEVQDEVEDDTIIEMRYGAKAEIDGATVYRQSQSRLYYWSAFLNQPFCISECGVAMSFTLSDPSGEVLDDPIAIEHEGFYTLINLIEYRVEYRIQNISGDTFNNATLTITPDVPGPIGFSPSPVPLGRFAPQAVHEGSFTLSTLANAEAVGVDFNLNLNKEGDHARVIFGVSELRPMSLALSPSYLRPNQTNIIVVKVTDSQGNPVEDASIRVVENSSGSVAQSGSTSELGFFNAHFSIQPSTALFTVTATKTAYAPVSQEIGVGSNTSILPQINCLTIDGAAPDLSSLVIDLRGGTTAFNLKNNGCGRTANVMLDRHADSDIQLRVRGSNYSFGEPFAVSDGESVTVNVRAAKEFGVHPIFITATLGGDPQVYNAGTLKVSIYDNGVCLILNTLASTLNPSVNKFILQMLDGTDSLMEINKCYSGVEGGIGNEYYPWNSITDDPFFLQKLIILEGERVMNLASHYSEQQLDIRNVGVTENEFFLTTIEDYISG